MGLRISSQTEDSTSFNYSTVLPTPGFSISRASQRSYCSAKTGRLRQPKEKRKSVMRGPQPPHHALSLFSGGGEHIRQLLRDLSTRQGELDEGRRLAYN